MKNKSAHFDDSQVRERGENSLNPEEQWTANILSDHLNDQADKLDVNVVASLSAARHRALGQLDHCRPELETGPSGGFGRWLHWQKTAPGLAAAMVLAMVVVMIQLLPAEIPLPERSPQTSEMGTLASTSRSIEDMQMLSASDELEFFQHIELLEWIESNSG